MNTLHGTNPISLLVQPAPQGETDPVALVLDFGREIAGRVQLTGPNGALVKVSTGESREEAALAGWAPPPLLTLETGVPQYTPDLGFRYVKLAFFGNAPYAITNLAADLKYYPVKYHGRFDCSDPLLTKIWYAGAYTAHLCMQEDIYDGVKRERLLWSGDFRVSGDVINDVFADTFLMEKDLAALRSSIEGGQPDTSLPQTEINSIPGYSAAWFCMMADFYRHVGDTAFLDFKHDLILSLLRYQKRDFENRNIFINPHKDWDFVDWSEDLTGSGRTDSPEQQQAADFFIIRGVREAVFMFNALGDTYHAAQYTLRADTLTKAACQHLLDAGTGTYTSRRQPNVIAILSGVATTNQESEIYSSVLQANARDWSNDITPYYAGFLLDVDSDLGHTQAGLDLARSLRGNMLAQGATTCWERYSPNWRWARPNLTHSPAGGDYEMSLCHAWSSGVTRWLTERVLGVRPASGGFQTAELVPALGDLQWAEGDVPTPNGIIHACVEAKGFGQTATIDVPTGTKLEVGLIGQRVAVDGLAVTPVRRDNGRVYVDLARAGRYVVTSTEDINFDAFSQIPTVDYSGGADSFHAEPSGEGSTFWGGREGYMTLLNTDMKREQEHLAKCLHLAVAPQKGIGFKGQFYIEPKPKKATTHQYDSYAATYLNLLREFNLLPHFKLNIEINHNKLAGHTMQHKLEVAGAANALGSIDANRGDELLGWDADQFPTSIYLTPYTMLSILKCGGLKTGGVNFATKVRHESFEPIDLFCAHVGGMDAFARGLKIASAIRKAVGLAEFVGRRNASWNSGIAVRIESDKASLKEIQAHTLKRGEVKPNSSGRQGFLENLINEFV